MARQQGRFQPESVQPASGDALGIDAYGTGIYFGGKMYPILVDGIPLQQAAGGDTRQKSMSYLPQKALVTTRPQHQQRMQQHQQHQLKKNIQTQSGLAAQFKPPGVAQMHYYQQQQLQPQFDQHQQLQQQLHFQPTYQLQQHQQQFQPHHQFQLQQQFVPHEQLRLQQQFRPQQQAKQQQQPKQQRRGPQQRRGAQQEQEQQQQQHQQQQQQQQQQEPRQPPQQPQQLQQQQQQHQQMQQFYGNNMDAFNGNQNPSQAYNMNPNITNSWPGYSMSGPADFMRTFAIDVHPL